MMMMFLSLLTSDPGLADGLLWNSPLSSVFLRIEFPGPDHFTTSFFSLSPVQILVPFYFPLCFQDNLSKATICLLYSSSKINSVINQ